MQIHIISLFPDIFNSFTQTSLVARAVANTQLSFSLINPRTACSDKHQQVDDVPYGGGDGMLIKAEPVISSIEKILESIGTDSYHIVLPKPSDHLFTQKEALTWSSIDHLIFVCGRYEGIDHRVILRLDENHPDNWSATSLGQFILLGGEVAAMTMIEATIRLIPGVIKESGSRQHESYDPLQGMQNIEHPQYTRPQKVRGMEVPEILLQGDTKAIAARQKKNAEGLKAT